MTAPINMQLSVAKQIGDNPGAFSMDRLHEALPRLITAQIRSRHSARAQQRALRRIDAVRAEIKKREAA